MTLNFLRSALYRLARLLGDVQAVRRGRIVERTHNRILGRIARKVLRGWWR
jgi:hypothetical protein